MISIIGLKGLPLVEPGDNLGKVIVNSAEEEGASIIDGDVVIITQKVVSKAEGRVVSLMDFEPSVFAIEVATNSDRDPRYVEAVLREAKRVVRMNKNVIITETKHGFICANSGIDRSNIKEGYLCLLPKDPDATANRIKEEIQELTGAVVAVIITDTWGRPWRLGQVDFVIGMAGMSPFQDYRGMTDLAGYRLNVTNLAVADELASAAELVKGKLTGIPVVIIRGYKYPEGEGKAIDLIRPEEEDLFR
jgi:coenzyme F420-0:L-glutamate ligase/coenzyme F420-1:gamma-L-glutamate ligase